MSDLRAVTMSQTELIVLGCLSQTVPPESDALGDALRELWLHDTAPARARELAVLALDGLRLRGLVDSTNRLTDAGARALRIACGLTRRPTWSAFRSRHFPAVVLGVAPADATVVNRLASKLGVASAPSLVALCDALIADQLGMAPGTLTLAQIRVHVLARRAAARARRDDAPPRLDAPPAAEPPADLLAFVRETLPQVGAEGRYGSEKVFVSALWQRLARHGSPSELSLDHFKRWLVTANRNRWLTLARADVVGAMDPAQVRDSEIRDLGATFHFVLDPAHNPAAQQGRSHVR